MLHVKIILKVGYIDVFNSQTKCLGICDSGNFWKLSNEVLNCIESGSYFVAKKKFINNHY